MTTLDDDTSETDETFQVSLGQPTNATLADGTAIGAIRDDDGLPRISIADTTVAEDDSPAIFDVTLSHTSSEAVTVDYATSDESPADGAATAGDDYATSTGAQGTLTIPAGLIRGEISVYVADDDVAEGSETFHITLSNPVNAVIAEDKGTATATIRDDDRSTITISGARASEGDGTIEFTVTLSQTHSQAVTVDYTTFDGSAVQPDDYTAAAGTLTIAAGATAATVPVALTDDTYAEDDESFLVRLGDPAGAEVAVAEAIGIILDDDDLPILDVDLPEPPRENAGTYTVRFTLSRPTNVTVSFDYQTRGRWPAGCAAAHANESGTVEFSPGQAAEEIVLTIVDDNVACSNDQWRYRLVDVLLTSLQNAEYSDRLSGLVSGDGNFHIEVMDDEKPPYIWLSSFLRRHLEGEEQRCSSWG